MLIFIELLLRTRHSSKYFTRIISILEQPYRRGRKLLSTISPMGNLRGLNGIQVQTEWQQRLHSHPGHYRDPTVALVALSPVIIHSPRAKESHSYPGSGPLLQRHPQGLLLQEEREGPASLHVFTAWSEGQKLCLLPSNHSQGRQ